MELNLDTYIQSNNYWYRVKDRLASACYVASIIYQADKGLNESYETFLLVPGAERIKFIQQNHGDLIVETVLASGSPVLVLRNTDANRELAINGRRDTPRQATFGANRYEGQLSDGVPHGKGTMTYGDGKKYIGEFVNGRRHGQGVLIMPNGESFKGLFQDDTITDQGTYYDESGNPRDVTQVSSEQSLGSKLWNKTWRLLAALGCFAVAAVCVWILTEFFSSGHGHIRGSVFIAPILFGIYGMKYLFGFFKYLFVSEQ